MVANLSAGGALLSGGPEVAPGTQIQIVLHVARRRPVALLARVMRAAPAIAVSFERLSPDQEDLIHDAVLSHLEFLRHEGPPTVRHSVQLHISRLFASNRSAGAGKRA